MITVKRGLDLPIVGAPSPTIAAARPVKQVALIGYDYHGMKPTMAVQVGDRVKLGQVLFSDKKIPGVQFTSPGAGTVSAIQRGEKRVFQSIVIDLEGDEAIDFPRHDDAQIAQLQPEAVRRNLIASGLWTAFRTRPYSKTPAIDATPASLFVTAIDTHPLAAPPAVVLTAYRDDFARGLSVLSRLLPEQKLFVCADAATALPESLPKNAVVERFAGPHPAGLPGTHIHFFDPVDAHKSVWQIGYQDVIAIGKLFSTGRLWAERIVALGGPAVKQPRLLATRLGANLAELVAGELIPGDNRVISGSVFGGRTAISPVNFLGRFHTQVSCLAEGRERELLAFLRLGANKHSVLPLCLSALTPGKKFAFSTTTNGSPRALVPVGAYEKVMPLDILATQLLRYLIVGDTDMAQKLGALELDEEDLALCTYVCAGKYEYGPILRDVLTRIEAEG